MIGILAEKPSALRNMAAALGGTRGTYNGESYVLAAARGHLYKLVDPEKQVDKALYNRYKKWDISNLPWDEHDIHWKYEPAGGASDTLSTIKGTLSSCDEICIATDNDPTGEGELLAWEILDQLKLAPRKWTRMYFVDESKKELQKAFKQRKQIPSMDKDPDYIKAFYRSRWDFMSMQFTRIATKFGNGKSLLRQGRLKSAMVLLVGDALKAYNDYKKIPFYQNRFKDENGVIYVDPDEKSYPKKEDVPQVYHSSSVTYDGSSMKSQGPPKMLDLAALSSRLVRQGYSAAQVSEVYQRMYESQVVSYPRTEDKVITPEQFADLLPLVDSIASVVGVDPALLTHRTPRSSHVKEGGAHGANRPGPNVPSSLSALDKFDGKAPAGCARAIYELLAKNYLATLAEDYEYESQKGHVTDYPSFKGTASVPKKMGWKLVYDADADPDVDENVKGIGTQADPFVHEGFPPRPPYPTMKWLMTQLEKRNVGTGATRTSTYADITNPSKDPLLSDKKGKIYMTDNGEMSYRLLPGTNIGSLDITERVMNEMGDIATGSKDPDICLHDIQRMVREDIETMRVNGEKMRKELNIVGETERFSGNWNGKDVSFKREWGGHHFTDEECEKLIAGEEISFTAVSSSGSEYTVTGSLADQVYNGKKFVGFKKSQSGSVGGGQTTDEVWYGNYNGQDIHFKRNWGGHHFTDEECEKLIAGEEISFEATSKAGKPYTATGSLQQQEYNGNPYYGFKMNKEKKTVILKEPTDEVWYGVFKGENVSFKRNWGGHHFTDEECEKLIAGEEISFEATSKAGKQYTANGSLQQQEFNGNSYYGFKLNTGDGKATPPASWCGYTFTNDELAALEAGLSIDPHEYTSSAGKTFTVSVHFGKTKTGRMGIVPEFDKK